MQRSHFTKSITTTFIGILVLLLGATVAVAQQRVNLTAGPTSLTLPDGSSVPMWGYSCGAAVSGSLASCVALNPTNAAAGLWSPVVITVPSGQGLAINLTNNLSFGSNNIPTSIVIAGQLGGGLGGAPTKTASPTHENYSTTWPIASTGPVFVPPTQPGRVQSFATEVAGGTITNGLAWSALRPGTYLLESGTHPSIQVPMGLYGMLVVTAAPTATAAGTAYPGVSYNAEVPLLLSEIDAGQNKAVTTAVNTAGFSESAVLGPYSAQPLTSINLLNGGQGYTSAPTVHFSGTGGAVATAQIDTDPTSSTYQQVIGFTITNGGSYTSAPNVTISGGGGSGATADSGLQLATSSTCRTATSTAAACYPPAVNYTPFYYLINGKAFNKTNPVASLFAATPGTALSPVSGSVLVRVVNAGLRMHVPSVVGSLTGTPAKSGFSLIAEDGNPLPGVPRVQNEVFMAAGKTYDVMINVPAAGGNALPIYDRELSLSGNATNRDSGMLAYIGVNGAGVAAAAVTAVANPDTYNSLVAGQTLSVSDLAKGVIANDLNVYGVQLLVAPTAGTVTLNANGTFTYKPTGTATSDSFTYCANGSVTGTTCSSGISAAVTLGAAPIEAASGIICTAPSFTASNAKHFAIGTPGVLSGCTDAAGYPLTVDLTTVTPASGLSVVADANGGFAATAPGAGTYGFTFKPKNSQGTQGGSVTATVTFPASSGLTVTVVDGADHKSTISDYRWIIEEDRTFYVDPNCTTNPLPADCPTVTAQGAPAVFGTNFHSSFMPVVATGCTGALSCEGGQTVGGAAVVCDQGNGVCRTTGSQQTAVDPSQVHLDPTKRYYISILPGDAANPFNAGYAGTPDCSVAGKAAGSCGHGMGGAPVAAPCFATRTCTAGSTFSAVTVLTQPSPYPPAKLTVFVFEDDFPLNGEHDAGGGVDVLSPFEPGLGSFQVTLFDDAGGTGDATGQPTYDMFNMPLSNSLAGTIDPITSLDACPISTQVTQNTTTGDGTQKGIVGMIVTCPTFESDGVTLSPLAGQAVVSNLYQGRYGVMATPAADRIARGEEWLQTNTLDGQKAHDSFMRIGEPAFFQEFGPAGYHVTIGFANPAIINSRRTNPQGTGLCDSTSGGGGGLLCNNEVKGHDTTARMSRPPDERLYGSGTRDSFSFTQCYASLGDPDGGDFAFVKCDQDGNFDFTNVPPGNWKLTLFDQWNDQIVDGISTPVGLAGQSAATLDLGEVATHQWQANIYTRSFIDSNRDGVANKDAGGNDLEGGLALVSTNIRFRDGSYSNFNNTDLNGYAGFNEVFPLFNWYTIETDSTRYKTTGVHVVYDAGGPTDGNGGGTSNIAQNLANTLEAVPLPSTPTNLRVPGAVYCANADCTGSSIATGPVSGGSSGPTCTWNSTDGTVSCSLSTGRIDPPTWFGSYGWQGFSGQNSFLEFGKAPFAANENGGIHGHVIYASTRPFDDPRLLLQLSWEPMIPHVRINLYAETTAPDGSQGLTLVDHTDTSSFDDWAQGFRSDGVPNMNCPGQARSDLFFFGLENQPNYLDYYNVLHGTTPSVTPLPYNSQFKCYDGMHNWNQLQPAPYDGMYSFPSVTSFNPTTGRPAGTNCTGCTTNPDASDPYRFGMPMLKPGKYVVEVVVPPGYELVKEEDKNILIGDNYIAPVTQQFAGLGSVFILPDQAATGDTLNANNAQNSTNDLGRTTLPSTEGDTGSVEQFWPCVGEARTVPDFISLFPGSQEVAPFAGATRNLCDRKEVTVENQASALAKFYVFTSTHVASHFTGVITDDFTAEFDPFSPQFGEKFAPAYLPVSVKDWSGNEVSRVYSDAFGAYTGLNYSTWEVNPPNPTGYGPTMMVTCMNDPGAGTTPDPLFQPNYSQFCYELPFMPGQTGYFDTPVVPTSAFSEGYNHPDCNYPDATPAIASVTSADIAGPWVSAAGHALTINALGNQQVDNYGYSGPSTSTTPFNLQKVTRHYGFGTCSLSGGVCSNGASVTIGGRAASITSWSDTQIVVAAPTNVPACAVQQQPLTAGGTPNNARCGQLLITASNGKQSIDTVTVTVGGQRPTLLAAGQTIQSALDAAAPGDMIIVPPGTYNEILIMWKPVRLQGVGAASSIVNANPHPAGILDPWRKQIVCLFGLTTDGRPRDFTDLSCAGSAWTHLPGANANFRSMVVDRLTQEAVLGWDANFNGNLAEQLIEPSLMGAYEGAAITVVGKGVNIPSSSTDPFGSVGATGSFPAGTTFLTVGDCGNSINNNQYPSNFYCNPSSIDGLSLTNSSQGGGGIFVHGWGHNIQIANNRVKNNQGTLSGGITVGQGEHIDVTLAGVAPLDPPGSCETGTIPNQGLPFCYDVNVNVHNNAVTVNSSLGDELFSSTPAGAGGVTFCTGADYYKFNNNWVCGNMSTGDGGGFAHIGFIKNGDIEHNSILFNQSTNPTITTNGGGLLIMGAPDLDPACAPASNPDLDCVPDPASVSPSDGTGPGLVVNANLILGNAADAGSGGGLRMQHVNGTDAINFPSGSTACTNVASGSCVWNSVNVTNNFIVNNVAGWDGAGVSLLDSLAINIVNNTISSNDSTASSGVLFGSLFAPLASAPGTNCTVNNGTQSCPQVAGLVSDLNSPILQANLPTTGFSCPSNHGSGTGAGATCRKYSDPYLANDVIWQNRSFFIGVTPPSGSGTTGQQSTVGLFNSFGTTAAASQTSTGNCPAGSSYWEIGVRGDLGPANHSSGFSFTPTYSVLSDSTDYPGANNLGSNPQLLSQYCNGSRVPPELGSMGYTVNPGTNETNALPTPVFTLTPSATVDEGNNWINLRWGPLSLTQPVTGVVLGNYAPAAGSPVINQVPPSNPAYAAAPTTDFFGNPRKTPAAGNVDIGAVEVQGVAAPTLTSVTPNAGFRGNSYNVALVGSGFATGMTINFTGTGLSFSNLVVTSATAATATFTIAPAASSVGSHNVTVTVPGNGTSNAVTFTVSTPPAPTLTSVAPNTGSRSTTVAVTLTGTNFTTAGTTINISGVGVSATGTTVISATQITANFVITAAAGLGTHNVSVTTPGGTSGTQTFTVAGATLTSISPASAARGTTVNVTLTGTGLTGATSVTVSGTGVAVSNFVAVNATTVTATFTIASNAASGATSGLRTVTVNTPNGPATINFRVLAATLGFAGPAPALTTTPANTSTKTGLVTVSNTATGTTAGPFTFTAAPAITKVGAAGGTFSIIAGGTCANGLTLAPAASCTINVQYAPGTSTATATANVTVTGTGIATASVTSGNFTAN